MFEASQIFPQTHSCVKLQKNPNPSPNRLLLLPLHAVALHSHASPLTIRALTPLPLHLPRQPLPDFSCPNPTPLHSPPQTNLADVSTQTWIHPQRRDFKIPN